MQIESWKQVKLNTILDIDYLVELCAYDNIEWKQLTDI